MVNFAAPASLGLLLVPSAAVLVVVWRHRRRLQQQRRLASPAVWDRLMGGAPATGLIRLLGWCITAALVILALARPQWGERPAVESVMTRDLVVAVDVSASMLCPDVRPSRLRRGLEVLQRAMPGLEGNRVGVVVFAGDAYPLVPLTTDLHAAASFLGVVEPGMVALPGSNIQRAVSAGLELLPEEGEGRVLVLITDGENLQGDVDAAIDRLNEAGVGVLAIVAGTEQGGPIPERSEDGSLHYKRDKNGRQVVTRAQVEVLARLAEASDGEVIALTDTDAVRSILDAVADIRAREVDVSQTVERIERFPIFLALAALVLMGSFVLSPWRRRAMVTTLPLLVVMFMLLITSGIHAQVTNPGGSQLAPAPAQDPAVAAPPEPIQAEVPWWQRWLPGGSRRLARSGTAAWEEGDVEAAAKEFAGAAELDPQAPDRLFDFGTALAASGRLEQALETLGLAQAAGVEHAAFNAGTAALEQGQAEAAVDLLRQAVIGDPDDVDAKRNYELALQLLEQQEQEQDENQDENEDEQEENEDQQEEEKEEDQEQPSPTPSPSGGESGAQPTPTPTPDPSESIYAALERSEAEAREAMQSPTPQASVVEKDW